MRQGGPSTPKMKSFLNLFLKGKKKKEFSFISYE